MIFLLSFYLSIRKRTVREFVNSLVPEKYQNFLENFINAAKEEIGAWARGMCLLCLFVGGLVYLGLIIMGVKYSLTLAVIAGLFEIIPYVGPWLAGVIAAMVALTQSPSLALFVIIFYLVVQQIENAVISPNIMHRAVGLDPMVVIVALLIGGKLAGPMGMILAVPLATIITILIKYYLRYKKGKEN
jgi:predicted PurR-regulated permease PerM